MFDDVQQMISEIKKLDGKNGMICRNVAGYAWEWKTKNIALAEIKAKEGTEEEMFDIEISGHRYIWNTVIKDWILSSNAINEIGCIHTIQGFDLSYVGVIFGPEIDYFDGEIVINRDKVFDNYTKRGAGKELKTYITNLYKVLMTRGIHGCYVFACNPRMKKYLETSMPKWIDNPSI